MTSESRTIGGSGTAVTTSFSYDNASRVTTITHEVAGGSALATYAYGYDNANRVTSETNAEGSVTYTYDAANELTGVSGARAETYTYDSGGNRTMSGYATGTGNELTTSPGHTYTYDNEGNLQTDVSGGGTTTYTYDYRNRLTSVNVGGTVVATYVYDALDRRIGFKDNGTQTWVVWDDQNPYADFDGSGTLKERYLYGPALDELFARTDSGGTTTAWYLTDRLGTVRDLVNASGTALDHLSYDSYGNVLSESNAGNGDRFEFTGREYDAATGLNDHRARWYAAAVGRFDAQDPIGFLSMDLNTYRYTGNGPINYTDRSGKYQDPENPDSSNNMNKYKQQTDKNQSASNEKQGEEKKNAPPSPGGRVGPPYIPGQNRYPGRSDSAGKDVAGYWTISPEPYRRSFVSRYAPGYRKPSDAGWIENEWFDQYGRWWYVCPGDGSRIPPKLPPSPIGPPRPGRHPGKSTPK